MNVALDVATYLAGLNLGLTLGTNLFWGPEETEAGVPINAVFVVASPGARPDRNMAVIEHRIPMVTIRVRNSRQATGFALAQAILDALQGANVDGYMDCRALQSAPATSNEARAGLYRYTMSFELVYESTAA